MRHATDAALDRLDDLLEEVRQSYPGLKERKRGAFYRGAQGWLHFHEDAAGLFADLKVSGAWARHPVNSGPERKAMLDRLAETLRSD
jgi:hypothetical protein